MTARRRFTPLRALPVALVTSATLLAGAAEAIAGKPWLPPLKQPGAVVWVVGDGADGGAGSRAVGELIGSGDADRFLYLGDVYETGTAQDYADNYKPLFGSLTRLTAPVLGNHEWANRSEGYLPYWTAARGRPPHDWYSIKASGWQLIGLSALVPHDKGSPQMRWLQAKLRRTPSAGNCRIAFMHHPRYSASTHGDERSLAPLWKRLRGRAVLALGGHDHNYQRFRPVGGLTQVVVGSGGRDHSAVDADPRLAFADDHSHGAVRIKLRRHSAKVQFVDTSGSVLDSTAVGCGRGRT